MGNREENATTLFVGRYCQQWIWSLHDLDEVKTYLPFFEAISLILPPHIFNDAVERDPVLAQPLYEQGLLINRDPSEALSDGWGDVLTTALRDTFDRMEAEHVRLEAVTIAVSHLGTEGKAREQLLQYLRTRGFVTELIGDGRFHLTPEAFATILRTCATVMCVADRLRGIDAVPFTTDARTVGPWWPQGEYWGYIWTPTLLSADIATVGFDLSKLPLDEVLAISSEHGPAYRAYLRGLRESARALDTAAPEERDRILADREIEILDMLADLKRRTRLDRWKRTVSVGLGTAGGSWGIASGNPIGGAIAAAAALVNAIPTPEVTSLYSYLFHAAARER